MKNQKAILRGLLVLATVLGLFSASFAQTPAQQLQQQQQQQQQMLRMQNMVQALTKVMERAQNMVRNLEQRLQNLPENALQAQEQHRNLMHMGEAMERVADNMKKNIERFQEMIQNRELMQNREMSKEMDGLQTAMEKVTGGMEEVLAILERISKRLGSDN